MQATNQDILKLLPRNRVLRHVLFWIWVYLLDVVFFGLGFQNIELFMKLALLEMPGQVFFAYTIMYWVMPRYLMKKHFGQTIAITVVAFFICGFGTQFMFKIFRGSPPEEGWVDLSKVMLRGFYCFLKACIAILIKLALLWFENEKRLAAMEKNKLESELKILKDQVNPHFMFNTLNNLYGLVGKNPVQAQESILRLSGILHFMLHESNHATIPMHLEIKCIHDYIELEKLRYAGTLSVAINVQPDIRDIPIVPLVLFPFVENSFKHGASERIKDAWINIDLSIYNHDFIFKVANSKSPVSSNGTGSKGIGLYNVKRRLELIYGKDHTLQIIEDHESYLAILKVSLARMEEQPIETYEGKMSYH
jgi:hypothetical protein